MAVRRAHHGNLDTLIAEAGDTSGPFSFDRGPPFELKTELTKEIDRRAEVLDDDSHIVHPFERHQMMSLGIAKRPLGAVFAVQFLDGVLDKGGIIHLEPDAQQGDFFKRGIVQITAKMLQVGP